MRQVKHPLWVMDEHRRRLTASSKSRVSVTDRMIFQGEARKREKRIEGTGGGRSY